MKIVVNRCFGGFGVSIAAMKDMIGRCSHVTAHEPIEYYGSKKRWEEDKKCPYNRSYRYFDNRGWPVTDEHQDDGARTCPILIETVERMGKDSFGKHALLDIVEIPDNIQFEIEEYNGDESIHEKHRSW
jgi:hypothetical protein